MKHEIQMFSEQLQNVRLEVEGEVLCLDDVTTNSQFKSHISHGTHIGFPGRQ